MDDTINRTYLFGCYARGKVASGTGNSMPVPEEWPILFEQMGQ